MPWYFEFYRFFIASFSIKDCVEIIFCATVVYYFSQWLKQDKQKNLLLSFYGYCITFFGCYYAGLPTITFLLFITAPLVIMLFIITHQELLQKNFIALANITSTSPLEEADWLATVLRACLISINNNKAVHGIIEHKDSLATMLTANIPLHTDVQKNVLSMALESPLYEQEKMIWLSAQGKLRGINTQWNSSPTDIMVDQTASPLATWQQEALFYTHKTDAIIFSITPISRTFTLIAQGKIVEHINAHHALDTIKKFLSDNPLNTGDKNYEIQSQKKSTHQRIS